MSIQAGLQAEVEHTVTDADTAAALGSGDVPVLGTPAVVALCERAAVTTLAGALEANQTSVGTRISIDHVAPTAPGRTVKARARLERVDRRTLTFAVEASDDAGTIASGTHTRIVVDRQRFLSSADQRS